MARNSLVVYQEEAEEETAGQTKKIQEKSMAPSTQKPSMKKKAEMFLKDHRTLQQLDWN